MNSTSPQAASPSSPTPNDARSNTDHNQGEESTEAQPSRTAAKNRRLAHPASGHAPRKRKKVPIVRINGAEGEGGGQVLRTALSLSAVLDVPVELRNIRGNRHVKGLAAQHVVGAKLVAQLAGAELKGASLKSKRVTMGVGNGYRGRIPVEVAVDGAGATSLVLLAALPVMLRNLREGEIFHIEGGTTCLGAPTSDYVRHVFVPNMRLFGVDIKYEVVEHGFFAEGKGKVKVHVEKKGCVDGWLRYLSMRQYGRTILSIEGSILACGREYIDKGVVEAVIGGAISHLRNPREQKHVIFPVPGRKHFTVQDVSGQHESGKCVSLTLYGRASSGCVLGCSVTWTEGEALKRTERHEYHRVARTDNGKWKMWRRVSAEMGVEAARHLLRSIRIGADFDGYMADQVVIFMAMANGPTEATFPRKSLNVKSVANTCKGFGVNVSLHEVGEVYQVLVHGKGVKICDS